MPWTHRRRQYMGQRSWGSRLPAHLETLALLSWQPAVWRLGYAPCCRRHKRERWLRWEPPDARERKRRSGNVVKMKNKKMSGLRCSPKPITALSPFTSKPAAVTQALTPLHRDTATVRRPVPLLSVQPARCVEALSPPHSRWELGLVVLGSCLLQGKENDAGASLIIKIKKRVQCTHLDTTRPSCGPPMNPLLPYGFLSVIAGLHVCRKNQ